MPTEHWYHSLVTPVAGGARIALTDTQTHRHAQTKYCNPCCAYAPRVNYLFTSTYIHVQPLLKFRICVYNMC